MLVRNARKFTTVVFPIGFMYFTAKVKINVQQKNLQFTNKGLFSNYISMDFYTKMFKI